MSKKSILVWKEEQILSNLFRSELIHFPMTRFQLKVTDEEYFKINLNLPIVLVPKLTKRNEEHYCLVAEIQSFDKAINNDVYLQVYAYSRFRILRLTDTDFLAVEVKDRVSSKNLDSNIAGLIDVISDTIQRLIKVKGVESYTFRERLQTYLSLFKENYYDSYSNNGKYLNLLFNLANDILKLPLNRLKFFYLNFQQKIDFMIILIVRKLESILLENKIQNKLQHKLAVQQKQYLLNERIKLLQSQLDEEEKSGWPNYWKKGPKHFVRAVKKEMKRLNSLNKLSPEYPQQKKVVEVMTRLPWESKPSVFNEEEILRTLDESHYGLKKIKESIVDYMKAYEISKTNYHMVLCLVGGPGIGKTSIAKSIAKALNREFYKISLAGCSDGSYLLGSSRVYIYSQPGAIINTMIKSQYNNPLILLDEIDKTIPRYNATGSGVEYALLDILDSENNNSFKDHFIEEGYSLSKIMFIATANDISAIPQPLKDRIKLIHIDPYDWNSKIQIAQGWLLPKLKAEFRSECKDLSISEGVIQELIENYTYELGVRQLRRLLEKLCIGFLRKKIKSQPTVDEVIEYLRLSERRIPFDSYTAVKSFTLYPGRSLGVWATAQRSIGGIMGIDIYTLPNPQEMKIGFKPPQVLGQVSDVMKETAYQAYLAVINHLQQRGEEDKVLDLVRLQSIVSYTGMAVPKDGPSAGLATAVAMLSYIRNKPIKPYVCTGEINGRGEVLVVGGIAEKIQGIIKNEYKHFVLPLANREDIEKLNRNLTDRVEITYVSKLEEVVDIIF